MIDDCRHRIAQEQGINPREDRVPPLSLTRPEPAASVVWQLWVVILAAILFDLVLLSWLTR